MAHAIRENFPAAFLLQTRVRKQPAVTFLLPWGLRLRPQGFPGAVLPYKMRFLFWWDRMTLSPASLIITPQHVVAAHLPAVCWSSSVMAGIKIEGNAESTIFGGGTCATGQATV